MLMYCGFAYLVKSEFVHTLSLLLWAKGDRLKTVDEEILNAFLINNKKPRSNRLIDLGFFVAFV